MKKSNWYKRKLRALLFATIMVLSVAAEKAYAADASYEAWYDTTITVPGQPVQKGKLHTYFDGKKTYSKQDDGSGNVSATVFEMPFDTTTPAYVKMIKGTPVGTKPLDGKTFECWQFKDQVMGRPTTNYFDESGHLYFQSILKYTGSDGNYEQRRTKQLIDQKADSFINDPAFKDQNASASTGVKAEQASTTESQPVKKEQSKTSAVVSPKLGSPERTALLDCLRYRDDMKKLADEWKIKKVIFFKVTNFVKDDWAYVAGNPGTPDGKKQLDPVSAVLHRQGGKWEFVDYLSDEIASADDANAAFKKWADRFVKDHKGCPREIFPAVFDPPTK